MDVPRIKCPTHGVHQVQAPWAEENSSFTALFEAFVISWLKEASTLAVTRLLDITWDQVDGIMKRTVERGLRRRVALTPTHMVVDETSFQKRHEYVTMVHELQTSEVLWVADGHGKEALNEFYEGLPEKVRERIQAITMDMWKPYIFSTAAHIPEAEKRIAFDRFHVVQHLSKAVDKVRREEHRKLMKDEDESLTRKIHDLAPSDGSFCLGTRILRILWRFQAPRASEGAIAAWNRHLGPKPPRQTVNTKSF